jgi:hypothetical protein
VDVSAGDAAVDEGLDVGLREGAGEGLGLVPEPAEAFPVFLGVLDLDVVCHRAFLKRYLKGGFAY